MKMTEAEISALGKVAVLFGGNSAEREISLLSGRAVFNALQSAGVDVTAIDTRDNPLTVLQSGGFDRVFNMLHGRGGEDGKIQGVLELLGLPYTGSGVLASALSMDKLMTKLVWRSLDLPTPDFEMLQADSDWQAIIGRLQEAVVKPVREGSSIGMSIVRNADELEAAYNKAAEYDSEVMAEKRIVGAEFTVAILGDQALPVIKLATPHIFYDFDAKYVANDTQYECPANLPAEQTQMLQALCVRAFQSLDCRDWGRVDVMQDSAGSFWLLEVNTVPGMTDHSLVPRAAAAKGMDFEQLVLAVLTAGMKAD